MRPSTDEAVRPPFLLGNDLAVILRREQITEMLGVDPLSRERIVRWTRQLLDVYEQGSGVPERGTP